MLEEPPAPAAREEFGRETCEAPAARRLRHCSTNIHWLKRSNPPNLSTRGLCDTSRSTGNGARRIGVGLHIVLASIACTNAQKSTDHGDGNECKKLGYVFGQSCAGRLTELQRMPMTVRRITGLTRPFDRVWSRLLVDYEQASRDYQ